MRKEHATTGEGVSRARDDRLAFKAGIQGRLGAVTIEFSVTGPGVAGLLALLACAAKSMGKGEKRTSSARVLWSASVIGREKTGGQSSNYGSI
jgi:hypothetical protein